MKPKLITVVFLLWYLYSHAQSDNKHSSYGYISPSVGYSFAITPLLKGEFTDNLIKYDNESIYWQLIPLDIFIYKNWGIELVYQLTNQSKKNTGEPNTFLPSIEDKYGNDYYILNNTEASYKGSGMQRVFVGPFYAFHIKNFLIMPRFTFGTTKIEAILYDFDLKKKGENELFGLRFEPNKKLYNFFTWAPSISLGYQLTKGLLIKIDGTYASFKADIEYVETFRNKLSNEKEIEITEYQNFVTTYSLGLGIIFDLYKYENN